MADERLLTISTFARAVGISASALRHYSAQGLLAPAEVDPVSGYRYYGPEQIADGVLVQRLRAAAAPLSAMREVLAAPGPDRAALIDELLAAHSARSTELHDTLRTLREELSGHPSARLRLSGPVLANALRQVLRVAANAAPDLAGVVWSLGPTGLALSATDRYWLAHRLLPARSESPSARLITTTEAAQTLAEDCGRMGALEVEIAGTGLSVRRRDGTTLFATPSADRAVPDLARLVASQPPARAVVGFPRTDLEAFAAADGAAGPVRLRLELTGAAARLRRVAEPAAVLEGWAAPEGAEAPKEVLLQAALLASAAACCPGEDTVLALVDGETPVRVLSPVQDTLTCLVMPMRP